MLTNSAFSRENLYRVYGIDAHLCYLGVDLDTFRFLSLPKENFVLSVGGIVPQKGFDFLMRSLAHIDSAKRPRLMIVGNQNNPDERTYLESLALELGVDAQFCNMISDEELVRLYNRALLTVYMPIMEPFGFVPIESMACGTPVVGVREGGVRETVIHEQTGLLADRNPKPFAAAIESLLSDPVRREVYGQQGRDIVAKRWSWDQSVNHLEAELSEIANSASASFK